MNFNLNEFDNRVLQLISQRVHAQSAPGRPSDPHKLGLAIEGGAMRGVVTSGMVAGLEALGLRDVFDAVYGASGGASNGAYFLSGQAAYGSSIYYTHINGRDFIDFLRPLRGRPIINLDFLFNEVMTKRVVIDWGAIVDSRIEFKVIVTSVDDEDAFILEDFQSREDLLMSLHASARLPLLTGRNPLYCRGKRLWDAGIVDALAINTALADGCSHVLALRSRPRDLPQRQLNFIERRIITPHIEKLSPKLAQRFRMRFEPEVNGLAEVERSAQRPGEPPHLFAITVPPTAPNIHRMETRRGKLVAGAAAGVAAVFDAFGLPRLAST